MCKKYKWIFRSDPTSLSHVQVPVYGCCKFVPILTFISFNEPKTQRINGWSAGFAYVAMVTVLLLSVAVETVASYAYKLLSCSRSKPSGVSSIISVYRVVMDSLAAGCNAGNSTRVRGSFCINKQIAVRLSLQGSVLLVQWATVQATRWRARESVWEQQTKTLKQNRAWVRTNCSNTAGKKCYELPLIHWGFIFLMLPERGKRSAWPGNSRVHYRSS